MRNFLQLCGKQFPLQKILVRHMAQAHSIVTTSTMYECSECKETFTSSRMLTIHMNKDHDPDAPGEFPCEVTFLKKIIHKIISY